MVSTAAAGISNRLHTAFVVGVASNIGGRERWKHKEYEEGTSMSSTRLDANPMMAQQRTEDVEHDGSKNAKHMRTLRISRAIARTHEQQICAR